MEEGCWEDDKLPWRSCRTGGCRIAPSRAIHIRLLAYSLRLLSCERLETWAVVVAYVDPLRCSL